MKSDDVTGRSKVYESIVKGEQNFQVGVPESFNVLVKELQGLCLDVNVGRTEIIKEKPAIKDIKEPKEPKEKTEEKKEEPKAKAKSKTKAKAGKK